MEPYGAPAHQWSEQCRRRRSAHQERAGGRRAAGAGLALAVALSAAACSSGGGAAGPAGSNVAAASLKLSYTDSPGRSEFSVAESRRQGFVGNGTNTTLGDFDPTRIRRIIDITVPIYAGQNKPAKPGLTVADIATNDFVDPIVGLPR